MTPLPFYRTRLFWAGVPGLLFLLWVWLLAGHGFWLLVSDTTSYKLSIHSMPAEIDATLLRLIDNPHGKTTASVEFPRRSPFSDRKRSAPAFRRKHMLNSQGRGSVETWSVSIAHWLTVILYLAAWSALLLAWQRRKARRMNPAITEAAA